MVLFRFLMILASFGGLGGSRRAILGPMLGDVGCKMGPRWIQEGFEFEFFDQLGVLTRILTRPEVSGMERPGRLFFSWGLLGSAGRLGVRYSCLITAYSIQ